MATATHASAVAVLVTGIRRLEPRGDGPAARASAHVKVFSDGQEKYVV
jgi:hypothetical protein